MSPYSPATGVAIAGRVPKIAGRDSQLQVMTCKMRRETRVSLAPGPRPDYRPCRGRQQPIAFRRSVRLGPSPGCSRFRAWLEQARPQLEALDLPQLLYCDWEHWEDFLENGELHFHEDPIGYDIDKTHPGHLEALRAFLEEQYPLEPPPLLQMLRFRLDGEI